MNSKAQIKHDLLLEVADLRLRVAEVQDILRAIRQDEVDAFVVRAPQGDEVYALYAADQAYRQMVEQMREGAATVSLDGTLLYANRQLAALLGHPVAALVGQPLQAFVAPNGWPRLAALLDQPEGGRLSTTLLSQPAGRLAVSVSASRMVVDGQPVVLLLVSDLTRERHADRLGRLLKLSMSLSTVLSSAQAAEAVLDGSLQAFGASAGFVAVLGPLADSPRVLHAIGFPAERLTLVAARLAEPGQPLHDAVHQRAVIQVETAQQRQARYPSWLASSEATEAGASLTVPMLLHDRVAGGLHLCFDSPRAFEPEDADLAQAVAQQCAQALERARLYSELEQRVETRTAELRQTNDKVTRTNQMLAQLNQELTSANAQLVEVNRRVTREVAERHAVERQLERAREDERARMARELHDELGSALTVLKMDVSRLQRGGDLPAAAAERLRAVSAGIDQAVELVRRLASELHPQLVADLGLQAAMEVHFAEFTRRTGLAGEFTCLADDLRLTGDRATACFRIFQEALTNVARHAAATRVMVIVEADDYGLSLRIADDGRGMDVAASSASGHLGLLGMREHARLLGGRLQLVSAPQQGTTVHLYIPAATNEPDA